MNLEILRNECSEYISWLIKKQPNYIQQFENIQQFCRKINQAISDEDYERLETGYNAICNINNNPTNNLSVNDVINLELDFLEKISPELKKKFISDLTKGIISIHSNNPNKCLYLTKTIGDKKVNFCKVLVKYTGNINDVFILTHEYFHALTDIESNTEKKSLNKSTLNHIQEIISIFSELVCSKYFSKQYPTESLNVIFYRIYEEIFIGAHSGAILFNYLKSVMGGCSIDILKIKFSSISELRNFIQDRKIPFDTEHFIGTMIAVELLDNFDNSFNLLRKIYFEINKKNIDGVRDLIPMVINYSSIVKVVSDYQVETDKITFKKDN